MTAFDNANDRLVDLAVEVADLAAEHIRITQIDAAELTRRRLRIEQAARAARAEVLVEADPVPVLAPGRPRRLSPHPAGGASVSTIERPIAAGRLLERGNHLPVTTSDRGRRVVGSERQSLSKDLVKRYMSGESIRALAASTGRSYGFVHRVLTESGVQLRQRGGARRRKKA